LRWMCVRKVEKGFNGAPGGMEQGMGMGIGMASYVFKFVRGFQRGQCTLLTFLEGKEMVFPGISKLKPRLRMETH